MGKKEKVIKSRRLTKRGRKTLIEQLKNKHTRELEESIYIIEPKLIEAFIKVYGEKHREFITFTIKNMVYIFFISEKFLKYQLLDTQNKRNLYLIKKYLSYIKKQNNLATKISEEERKKFRGKKIITEFPFRKEDFEEYLSSIEDDCPCYDVALLELEEKVEAVGYIALPIFTIDLKTIIHEINHALNIHNLALTEEALIAKSLFETESAEELVNDFIAEEVLYVYLEIGGIIPEPLKRFKIGNEYAYKDYIVHHFFEKLYPLILESRASGNFNLFYELVGRENTNHLERMMDNLFKHEYVDEYLYHELLAFIDEIEEKAVNTHMITKEELFEMAEKSGMRVRKLLLKEDTL